MERPGMSSPEDSLTGSGFPGNTTAFPHFNRPDGKRRAHSQLSFPGPLPAFLRFLFFPPPLSSRRREGRVGPLASSSPATQNLFTAASVQRLSSHSRWSFTHGH